MNISSREIFRLLASVGVGLIPGPRGTWGSLLTLGLAAAWLAKGGAPLAGGGYLLLLAVVCAAALGITHMALRLQSFGQDKDPSPVVIDEVIGQLVALYGASAVDWWLVAGFAAFRLFDIAKPFPVGVSQKLPGAWGVVIDDILAGLYALGLLYMARTYLPL